jgi:glycosyltransferase involved in cell wall biosynthesis
MRIGLDAKWYFCGPVSTRTILQNLLPLLFEYKEHEWIIYLDQKDRSAGFPYQLPNVTVHYVWAGNNMLSNLFVLPRYIKKIKPDLIVFQTFPAAVNIPSIAFIHDVLFRQFPQFFTWKERMYFVPLSWLSRNATRLIATSEFVANDLVKYNYTRNRERIDIVPLGVSRNYKPLKEHNANDIASVRVKFGLPDKFILCVGRLNARKNIEGLLKALTMLKDQNIKLVIVGKEDWKLPQLELLQQSQIKDRVIFTGSVTNEELPIIYALATIFCFPSFAEGFGLPPIEAMASAVPVIASNATAIPEVCGDAAMYIDPAKPSSIAEAIDVLLTSKETYYEMQQKGLLRAAVFSWERTASEFMKSISNAVQTKTS